MGLKFCGCVLNLNGAFSNFESVCSVTSLLWVLNLKLFMRCHLPKPCFITVEFVCYTTIVALAFCYLPVMGFES